MLQYFSVKKKYIKNKPINISLKENFYIAILIVNRLQKIRVKMGQFFFQWN